MSAPDRGADSEPPSNDERLNEIEIKITYLDDLLESLNRTVFRQQQQIDQCAQALAALRRRLQTTAPAAGSDAPDEIPPHY